MHKSHFIILLLLFILYAMPSSGRERYNFNSDWEITTENQQQPHHYKSKRVTLPHAWNEDQAYRVSIYDLSDDVVWYRKHFRLPKTLEGKHVFIEFEGARQAAEVFLNGKRVGMHENGVMAFGFDLTPYMKKGDNYIEVRTDNDWNYYEQDTHSHFQWQNKNFNANYGGLPKNVWLHVTDDVYQTLPLFSSLGTTGTYIYAKDYAIPERTATICAEAQVKNDSKEAVERSLTVVVEEMDGREVARFQGGTVTIPAGEMATLYAEKRVGGLHFWSWGYGYLYKVKTSLEGASDCVCTVTGFRKTEYKQGMFYLNDRVLMFHGYAQRTSNEWAGVGMSVPAWLSDYSNDLMVKSGGNIVRWMHVTPWKQDVESCDRVGLLQAMPAGDAEKDVEGRRWQQRLELMRDAIIYMRNNPSIIFYECGNFRISNQHMIEMKSLRNQFDPNGGRAIGSREMLDIAEAEYGGEMLYVNKSETKPMWMMEYCRDEGLRWYWNSWSYPYHKEGDGPLYRNAPAVAYNHNQDEFGKELVDRWYEYWRERPGSGTRVNSGGAKIVFSDTQTHGRSADNYRVSGVVDPMRIEKDVFYVHQVMWDGWVDDLKDRTHIMGHWNYDAGFKVPTIYVVSTADSIKLLINGQQTIVNGKRSSHFLFTFKNVPYTAGTLEAVGYRDGKEVTRAMLETAGTPDHLKLTPIMNPTGWKADGADVALVQIEVVDKDGRRCPLDNSLIKWEVKGPAEFRGGVAKNKDIYNTNIVAQMSRSLDDLQEGTKIPKEIYQKLNHAQSDTLPVESGVNRIMLRSLPKAGNITITAKAEGFADAEVCLQTQAVDVKDGLTTFFPADNLPCVLDRGETPSTPSFKQWRKGVAIMDVLAGSSQTTTSMSYDGYENTSWNSTTQQDSAWITYTLAEKTTIDEICMKPVNFRSTTYPIAVYADGKELYKGWTPKTLGYVHLPLAKHEPTQSYTIKLIGSPTTKDAFGAVRELDSSNDEKAPKGKGSLKILEIEFLKNLK